MVHETVRAQRHQQQRERPECGHEARNHLIFGKRLSNMLTKSGHSENWEISIYLMYLATYASQQRSRASGTAHYKRHRRIVLLKQRQVHVGNGVFTQAEVFGILHHADNFDIATVRARQFEFSS